MFRRVLFTISTQTNAPDYVNFFIFLQKYQQSTKSTEMKGVNDIETNKN